jgi:2-methylcitrate dehydratase
MSFRRELVWQQMSHLERSSVAYQLARYALALHSEMLPEAVVQEAKRCLLDALGCALASVDAPAAHICAEVLDELGSPGEVTVIGSARRLGLLQGALLNSLLVRFLDLNDLGGGGHNSDAIAALLAVAERERSSGLELLTAIVVSYEIGARFGDAVSPALVGAPISGSLEDKGWTKDIRAGLNQPPAIGRLLGLNEGQIANAIGICMSHTLPLGILDAHREENTMAKNIRFGWASHDAILACLLARRGFTGPLRVVESEVGIRTVVARGEMELERLTDFGGWRILGTRFKSLAANGSTHGHVLATLALVEEHDLKPNDILEVRLRVPVREMRHTTAPPKRYPRNAESADHSAYYANAVAIVDRSFGVESTAPAKFVDPTVLDLIDRITVEPDPELGYYAGVSRITTRDGRTLERRVDQPHGFGSDPLSDEELTAKFRGLASRRLPSGQVERLAAVIWNLETCPDVRQLTALMGAPISGDAG